MKYLRIYWVLLKTNLINTMTYRSNFFAGAIITGFETVISFYAIKILFTHISGIAGWSYTDMMVLTGIGFLANSISWFTFRAGVEKLDHLINKGDFDFMLLRPISARFLVSVYRLDVEDAARGLVGISILLRGLSLGDYHIGFFNILLFLIAFLAGEIILYCIQISLKTMSFKTIQGWASNNTFFRIQEISQYPVDIYRGLTKMIYTFVIPVLFIATVPAKILLGKGSLWLALGAVVAAATALLVSQLIWRMAVKSYSSASS